MQLTRSYWRCPACGQTCAPADTAWELPPGNASWGVRAAAALVGALVPSFAQAADLLATLTPIQVSARALETFTEAVGDAYILPDPPATPPTPDLLVIQCDGGMVHMRPAHWQEVKGMLVYRREDGVDQPPRHAVVQGPWADHDDVLLALAAPEGLGRAREILCLADGARPIWNLLDRLFPDAFQLLDWYHLLQHLDAVAARLPDGATWQDAQATALWERGPQETLRALIGLLRQSDLPADIRDAVRSCFIYLWHNRARVDYAEARQRGYPCGSGRIESAIKTVVQARAKGPGMRWNPPHLQRVLNARCAVLNGDFALACAQAKTAALAPPRPPSGVPSLRPQVARPYLNTAPHAPRRVATARPAGVSQQEAARIIRGAFALG